MPTIKCSGLTPVRDLVYLADFQTQDRKVQVMWRLHLHSLVADNTFSLAPKPRPEDTIRSPLAAQLLEQDIIKPQSTGSTQSSGSQHMGRVTLRRADEVELAGVLSSRKSKGKKGKCQGIFAPFWQ